MLKAESSSKAVTPAQVKFLRLLHEREPMTALELAGEMGLSIQYVHAIIRELREGGMIEKTLDGIDMMTSERRLAWKYKLAVSIDELNVKAHQTHLRRISDEEILYAAILRNSGMTGRGLQDQFHAVYPNRTRGSIVNIVTKARQKKWKGEDGSERKWCR